MVFQRSTPTRPATAPTSPKAPARRTAAPAKPKGLYAGVEARRSGFSEIPKGTYAIRVTGFCDGITDYKKLRYVEAEFIVDEIINGGDDGKTQAAVGRKYSKRWLLQGDFAEQEMANLKCFIMSAFGFVPIEQNAEFDEFDREQDLANYLIGEPNTSWALVPEADRPMILGQVFCAEVTEGGLRKKKNPRTQETVVTDDYHRRYNWEPFPEESAAQ